MEWTKIPTDLLQSRFSDKEILAITKYQLLWAMLERQPSKDICLRYMTSKQLQQALNYVSVIEYRVNADIKSVENHRKRQKLFYVKNQELIKKYDGQSDGKIDSQSAVNVSEQIREDKIREDNNKFSNQNNQNNQNNHNEQTETETEKYKYKGNIIKLNEKDFNDWEKKYPDLDLKYNLDKIDLWFAEKIKEKPEYKARWFFMAQQMLLKNQKEVQSKNTYMGRG